MSVKRLLLLFTFLSVSTILPQVESYNLITIQKESFANLEKNIQNEIEILHEFHNGLFAKTNSELLKQIEYENIDYKLIDNYDPSAKYYLFESKKNINPAGFGEVLVQLDKQAILKNLDRSKINPEQTEITVTELQKYSSAEISFNQRYTINSSTKIDSMVNAVISQVNVDSVTSFIQSLQDFQTRYLFAPNRRDVAEWIKNKFISFGYENARLDSFVYNGYWQYNAVAQLDAAEKVNDYIVIGGHHDSITGSDPMSFAPGADDNASGTVAVIETARALKAANFNSPKNIVFVTFAAEERGLWGSKDYAQKALQQGMNISLMINHDMISYSRNSVETSVVDINRYTGSDEFAEIAAYAVENYTDLRSNYGGYNSAGSDSHSFWDLGFPAIYFEENVFSPYYHSNSDVVANYNMPYCSAVIQASCATTVMTAVTPSKVQDYEIFDIGNGTSLQLSWAPDEANNFSYFKIFAGNESGVYSREETTADNEFVLDGLTEGINYFVAVASVNTDGFESILVEKSLTPYSRPHVPADLSDEPVMFGVKLSWTHNLELDLAGYNIYRSENPSESFVKLNNELIIENHYQDFTTNKNQYYYYKISAVDEDENESDLSNALRSHPVTLQSELIIVDETSDESEEHDAEYDAFYNNILKNYEYSSFDVFKEDGIKLADIAGYKNVIWLSEDESNFTAAFNLKEDIAKLLNFGGTFVYIGYLPTKAFENDVQEETTFGIGTFVRDYLKIDYKYKGFGSRFNGAEDEYMNYPVLKIDSLKAPANTNYHLRNIESISASDEASEIYLYKSDYDPSSPQGKLIGSPVAVEYLGEDFKTITTSFPLYMMKENDAKSFLAYIVEEKLGLTTDVTEDLQVPTKYSLSQNYPNPFNPSTVISYQISVNSKVTLKIYDVLGREVAVLVNEYQPAGNYEVEFNAKGLSSGVYYYRIESGNFSDTKKMILLK